MNNNEKRIVFFDGVCGLCNTFADKVIRWDRNRIFLFAPLQGKTARENLEKETLENLGTIVYLRFGKTYTRSDAVLKIITDLGGWWRIAVVLYIFPRVIRNIVYDYIAKNRYRWFGKKESCRIPTPEERKFFID